MTNDKVIKAEFGKGFYYIGDISHALNIDLYQEYLNNNYANGYFEKYVVGKTGGSLYGKKEELYYEERSGIPFLVDTSNIGVVDMKYRNFGKNANNDNILMEWGYLTETDKLIFEYNEETKVFNITMWDKVGRGKALEIHTKPYTYYSVNGFLFKTEEEIPKDINEYYCIVTWNDWERFSRAFDIEFNKIKREQVSLNIAARDVFYRSYIVYTKVRDEEKLENKLTCEDYWEDLAFYE